MSTLREQLAEAWGQAATAAPAGHEWRGVGIATHGPVRVRAAVREPDERLALLLEVPLSAAPHAVLRLRADGVSATDQRRPDEQVMRLAITLERLDMREIFEILACDLIETIASPPTPTAAIDAAMRRWMPGKPASDLGAWFCQRKNSLA